MAWGWRGLDRSARSTSFQALTHLIFGIQVLNSLLNVAVAVVESE
jgi:hypothetical protein